MSTFQYHIFPIDDDGGSIDPLYSGDETTNIHTDVQRTIEDCPEVERIEIHVYVETRS